MSEPGPRPSTGALLTIGAATGVLAGLLGVGGGIIIVPALVALGYGRHHANAISLSAILLVAIAGLIGFGVAGAIDIPVGLTAGLGGLVGATAGAKWAHRLSGLTLARVFGVLLIVVGLRLVLGGGGTGEVALIGPPFDLPVAVAVGALAGIVSGLAGIGGGLILIPGMVFLLGLTQHTAEGSSLLAIIFTSAAGTRVNAAAGYVDWRSVWLISVTGVVLAPIAAIYAQEIPADTLARIFGVFVLGVSVRTLWKARQD